MIVHIIFKRGGDDRIIVVENNKGSREKMIDRLIDGGEDGG